MVKYWIKVDKIKFEFKNETIFYVNIRKYIQGLYQPHHC
jgi:hypothetical protein